MKMRVLILVLCIMLLPVVGNAKNGKALMLTVFGTSTEASVTFDELLPLVQKQFPERRVVIPYTSQVIRTKLNAKINDPTQKLLSPMQMLENLKKENYTDIVVVSTLLFPGVEHERLKLSVDEFSVTNKAINVSYTPPLLSEQANLQPVVNTLKKYLSTDGLNVVVTHGSHKGHAVEKNYFELANLVAKTYPNSRVASIEGVPYMEKTLEWVKESKEKDIRFLVFMFVAGNHAENDIVSDEEDSLFSLVKKMNKTPSVSWIDTKVGKRIASLGLDAEYRKILLDYYTHNVAK